MKVTQGWQNEDVILFAPEIREKIGLVSTETCIGINVKTMNFVGDIIDCDGWRNLQPEEAEELAHEYGIFEELIDAVHDYNTTYYDYWFGDIHRVSLSLEDAPCPDRLKVCKDASDEFLLWRNNQMLKESLSDIPYCELYLQWLSTPRGRMTHEDWLYGHWNEN